MTDIAVRMIVPRNPGRQRPWRRPEAEATTPTDTGIVINILKSHPVEAVAVIIEGEAAPRIAIERDGNTHGSGLVRGKSTPRWEITPAVLRAVAPAAAAVTVPKVQVRPAVPILLSRRNLLNQASKKNSHSNRWKILLIQRRIVKQIC